MNDPEPIDHILKKIKKKWDEDPEDWSVISNVDKDGNKEMLISQAPNTWWLKMRQINAYQNMVYGQEIRNIDSEINQQIKKNLGSNQSNNELLRLFGMMVPTKKNELLYTAGVELESPRLTMLQKQKIEEKNPNVDREFRKYIRRKWERNYFDRDQIYL